MGMQPQINDMESRLGMNQKPPTVDGADDTDSEDEAEEATAVREGPDDRLSRLNFGACPNPRLYLSDGRMVGDRWNNIMVFPTNFGNLQQVISGGDDDEEEEDDDDDEDASMDDGDD